MSAHQYLFNVEMSCEGCSGAINRVLGRLNGIDKVDISLTQQTVKVAASTASFEQVQGAISKTGKQIRKAEVLA